MSEPVRYRAFISYSHADEAIAGWLHRAIETYKVPAEIVEKLDLSSHRLAPVFRDREEMSSSTDLGAEIEKALAASDAMIVLCSPTAKASRWVNEEIRQFAALGGRQNIHALIVDGEPGSPVNDCIPDALKEISDTEYLAADVRPGKDGKPLARLKILAGLLGVRLDELRQREAKRHQRRLTAIAASSTTALVIAVALLWFAVESRNEAELAQFESETVTEFLANMLSSANPGIVDKDVTVRTVLDRAANSIDEELATQPVVEARLHGTIADTYEALGLYAEAEQHQLRRLEIHEALHSDDHPGRLDALEQLSWLKREQGLYEESLALASEVYERRLYALGSGHPDTLGAMTALAHSYEELARYDEADALFREVLEGRRDLFGEEHSDTASSLATYGRFLWQTGALEEARPLLEQAFEIEKRLLGEEHPDALVTMGNLTAVMNQMGDVEAATENRRRMLEIQRENLGEDHPHTLITMANLAVTLADQEIFDESIGLLEDAIAIHSRIDGEEHPRTLYARHNLGTIYYSIEDLEAAEALQKSNLESMKRVFGYQNIWTMHSMGSLARVLCRREKYDEAEAMFSDFNRYAPGAFPPDHPTIRAFRLFHVDCLVKQEILDQAEQHLLSVLTDAERANGRNSTAAQSVVERLIDVYDQWGRSGEADRYREDLAGRKSAFAEESAADVPPER